MEMTPFYVLSTVRSGSTVLTKTLDKHPEVFCAGELFYSGGISHQEHQYPFLGRRFIRAPGLLSRLNMPLMPFRIGSFLREFYLAEEKNGAAAVGFKLMVTQYNRSPAAFRRAFRRYKNIRPIVLIRRNILKQAVSLARARTTGVFHTTSRRVSEDVRDVRLKLEPRRLYRTIRRLEKQRTQLLSLAGDDALRVDYEDFSEWAELWERLCDHLGVAKAAMQPAQRKIGQESLAAGIENFDDIREFLDSTEYRGYLDD